MIDNFQKEQNELLEYILNIYFNNYWNEEKYNQHNKKHYVENGLELFITPVCNQKCEYCYLVKHGDELYPQEIRDTKQILKNLHILFSYLVERNVWLPRMDLFSGEIWGMEFGNKVLDVILEYLDKGLKIDNIMIPSNCSFLTNDKIAEIMQEYILKFKDRGTLLRLSASIDGKIVEEESRPYKSTKVNTGDIKNDEYYDKLFTFMNKNNLGFHPMISAATIEKQKENYVWWHKQLQKYDRDSFFEWYNSIMLLEVRDSDWTDEKIKSYLDWLNFIYDYDLKNLWDDNFIEFLYNIILRYPGTKPIKNKDGSLYERQFNFPENIELSYNPITAVVGNQQRLSCSAGCHIIVRLGDLSIVPCHRTAYPKFIYGNFVVENDKITGVHANNPFLMFNVLFQGTSTMFKCDHCAIEGYCPKGCLGSQYETSKDLFYPNKEVCNFYFARVIFVYHKLKKYMDTYQINEKFDIEEPGIYKVYRKLEEENPEEVKKWLPVVMEII